MKISAAFLLYLVIYHHYQHLYQQSKKLKDRFAQRHERYVTCSSGVTTIHREREYPWGMLVRQIHKIGPNTQGVNKYQVSSKMST